MTATKSRHRTVTDDFNLDALAAVRAAVYLRVSLDKDGDEMAVTRQGEDARAVARMRGWEIVETYVDNSVSASKAEVIRPEYERMLAAYKRGEFDALICYDLDRLTRQPRQLEDWIDEADKRGLQIITLNGEADLTTDGGRMYARIKAAVARAEIERKSARHKRANRQRAENGYWQFSVRPYGYERRDGRIEIVEAEAENVREAFRRYVAGETAYAIANDWNERGIPTLTGAPWSQERLRQLLRNPRYAGIVEHNGTVYDAEPQWTPILDARTWSDASAVRDGRTRAASWSTSTKHLLSGLLICDVCGSRMLSRPDHGNPAYACQVNWCVQVKAADVEPLAEAVILGRLADPKIVKGLRSAPDTAPIEAEIAELRKRRSAITDLMADGLLDRREARSRAEGLTTKIDAAVNRLAAMRRESPLTDLALSRSVPGRWKRLGVMERRRVLEELGLEIRIRRARKGRRPLDAAGQPIPDLDRIVMTWRDDA